MPQMGWQYKCENETKWAISAAVWLFEEENAWF